jgi:hypothetical protein
MSPLQIGGNIMRGMDKFAADIQKTESVGRPVALGPYAIFLFGLGLMAVDGLLLLLRIYFLVFLLGGVLLWIAALVMARATCEKVTRTISPRAITAQNRSCIHCAMT